MPEHDGEADDHAENTQAYQILLHGETLLERMITG
jgi:hypothetical protein